MKTVVKNIMKWLEYPERPIQHTGGKILLPVSVKSNFTQMKFFTTLLVLALTNLSLQAQMFVSEGTTFTGTGDAVVSIDTSFISNGELVLSNNFTLNLLGEGEIDSDETIEVPQLRMNGVNFDINGEIHVCESLNLANGTLSPQANGKLTILDSSEVASQNQAHVNGQMYHRGEGSKFFPVGSNGVYTPVSLTNVQSDGDVEVGLKAYNFNLGIEELPGGVTDVSNNWYWQIFLEGDSISSPIILPVTPSDLELLEDQGMMPVVVQSQGPGMNHDNLGGEYNNDSQSVSSTESAKGSYFLLGFVEEVDPIIHNIITPGDDDDNPYLIIENIEVFRSNEVSLIDRWGNEVYRENDFVNYNDSDNPYNGEFDELPSGNYVCILRYNNQTETRMVSIIRK